MHSFQQQVIFSLAVCIFNSLGSVLVPKVIWQTSIIVHSQCDSQMFMGTSEYIYYMFEMESEVDQLQNGCLDGQSQVFGSSELVAVAIHAHISREVRQHYKVDDYSFSCVVVCGYGYFTEGSYIVCIGLTIMTRATMIDVAPL